jgi:phosphocarrier protein HPr
MPERIVTIVSEAGLHARPAALFTQAVGKSGIKITVSKGAKTANAASILGVISLGVSQGEVVTLASEDEGADAVLDQLVELLSTAH